MKILPTLILFIASILVSCHNADEQKSNTKSSLDSTQTSPVKEATSLKTERQRLIEALQKLQHDIASKDKEAIAAYFQFPVQIDDLQAFDISDAYEKEVQQNNYKVSRQLFLTHFTALYDNLEMQGFTDMFVHLPLTKLQDTATKLIEASRAENICRHFYSVALAGKEVTLQYGVNTDEDYLKKHPNEKAECPEYAAFWTFIFDGEKLVFNRHQVAG